jgi:hypothetical protein
MVDFIQYMLPDGKARETKIVRPAAIELMASVVNRSGYVLEIEILTTGDVSMTVSDEDHDMIQMICPNDESVPGQVDILVRRGHALLVK